MAAPKGLYPAPRTAAGIRFSGSDGRRWSVACVGAGEAAGERPGNGGCGGGRYVGDGGG